MIRAIILDFDGVILESVEVKTEAFRKLFSFFPEQVDEIVQFHIDNGGMSRFDKFRYIYENILHEELTRSKFDDLSNIFSEIVFNKVIKTPFVPGAQEFLEKYYTTKPLYVVSATPENELRQIIEKRGMSHYFRKVFGAPRKKTECIIEILTLTGSPQDSVIFVGDAKNDFETAQVVGIRFIGRIKPGDENRFEGLTGIDALIPDLHELAQYIEVDR
jgi:phosphoglycolate phosphatase-like HAD superfamily hydrolase